MRLDILILLLIPNEYYFWIEISLILHFSWSCHRLGDTSKLEVFVLYVGHFPPAWDRLEILQWYSNNHALCLSLYRLAIDRSYISWSVGLICQTLLRLPATYSICGEAQCTMWHDSVARRCEMVSRVQCVCCHRACGKTQRTTAQDAVIKYSNTPTGEGGKQ